MKKYQFDADLNVLGKWAFQPPGYWRSATWFVWAVNGEDGLGGIFTATHQAYARKLLDRARTEDLFFAGTLLSDIETSIVLEQFNFPVKLSEDALSMIIGLSGYGIHCAAQLVKAPDAGVVTQALCLDELLNAELKAQVVEQSASMVWPKPNFLKSQPPQHGSEPRNQ